MENWFDPLQRSFLIWLGSAFYLYPIHPIHMMIHPIIYTQLELSPFNVLIYSRKPYIQNFGRRRQEPLMNHCGIRTVSFEGGQHMLE